MTVRWLSPPQREPMPCQYQGSVQHTPLIRGALMLDIWPGRSSDRRISQPPQW
jgi:hypothetical protein